MLELTEEVYDYELEAEKLARGDIFFSSRPSVARAHLYILLIRHPRRGGGGSNQSQQKRGNTKFRDDTSNAQVLHF